MAGIDFLQEQSRFGMQCVVNTIWLDPNSYFFYLKLRKLQDSDAVKELEDCKTMNTKLIRYILLIVFNYAM